MQLKSIKNWIQSSIFLSNVKLKAVFVRKLRNFFEKGTYECEADIQVKSGDEESHNESRTYTKKLLKTKTGN